jgi:hypothetical protein
MGTYKIGKIKTQPTLLVNEGVEVTPNHIITTNLDLGVYNDITSIENWDIYGMLYLGDLMVIRNELTTLINQIGWVNLNGVEKLIGAKYFVVTKQQRNEVLSDDEQMEYGDLLFKKNRNTKSVVGDIFLNKTSNEITEFLNNSEGQLFNYLELNIEFGGNYNNIWHQIQVPNVEPNSVIMISIRNSSGKRYGGVRQTASNLDRKFMVAANSDLSLVVKTDSESKIEVFKQDNKISFNVTAQLS